MSPLSSPVLLDGCPQWAGERSGKAKKWIVGFLIASLAVALAVGIPLYLHHRHTHVSTDDAFVDGYIYTITSRIPGKIVEILVGDNQPVEAGQRLVQLDTSDFEADVRIYCWARAGCRRRANEQARWLCLPGRSGARP